MPVWKGNRQLGDSNPCGQSPMDFESISLTARTQCLGEGSQIAYWHTNVQYQNATDEDFWLWFVRVVLVQEPWQYVLCLSHCIGLSAEESRRSAKCECINIQAIIVIGFYWIPKAESKCLTMYSMKVQSVNWLMTDVNDDFISQQFHWDTMSWAKQLWI